MNISTKFSPWWDLVNAGHYRLDASWDYDWHVPESTEAGNVQYTTKRCGLRSCWACQYRQRRRIREKVSDFVDEYVLPAKNQWKFVTLTLPGNWYDARYLELRDQHELVSKAFRSWRNKMKYRGYPISGVAVFEHVNNNDQDTWHCHIHMLVKWNWKIDFAIVKQMWTESVDKPMRRQLASWTDGKFTNDSRVWDFKDVDNQGIAGYLTKVTNYLVKGPKRPQENYSIAEQLYKKRLVAWLGDFYGTWPKQE